MNDKDIVVIDGEDAVRYSEKHVLLLEAHIEMLENKRSQMSQRKYLVEAVIPVWAWSPEEAAEKVRGHTSRGKGIRPPIEIGGVWTEEPKDSLRGYRGGEREERHGTAS